MLEDTAVNIFSFSFKGACIMEKRKFIVCAAVCLVMTTGAWAGITDGLISYWALDDGAGLNATDSVGGNDGTLTFGGSGTQTPQWTAGKFGGALDFDGIGAFVDCGADVSLQPATVTVSAWIKVPEYGYYGQIAGLATDTDLSESGYSLLADDYWISDEIGNVLAMWVSGGPGESDGNYIYNTAVPAPPTDWVHVVGTYDGTQTIIYVNGLGGAPDTTESGDIDYTHITSFYMGVYWTPGFESREWFLPFIGRIDDVAVWGRAISPDEVSWLYNDGVGNPVPEPMTVTMLSLGGLGLLWRKRR